MIGELDEGLEDSLKNNSLLPRDWDRFLCAQAKDVRIRDRLKIYVVKNRN